MANRFSKSKERYFDNNHHLALLFIASQMMCSISGTLEIQGHYLMLHYMYNETRKPAQTYINQLNMLTIIYLKVRLTKFTTALI